MAATPTKRVKLLSNGGDKWWFDNKIFNPQCQLFNNDETKQHNLLLPITLYSNHEDCQNKCTTINRLNIPRDIQKYTLSQYIDTNDIFQNPSLYSQLVPIIYQNFKSANQLYKDWLTDPDFDEINFLRPDNIEATKIVLNRLLTETYNNIYYKYHIDEQYQRLLKFIFKNVDYLKGIISEKGWLKLFNWLDIHQYEKIFGHDDTDYIKTISKLADIFANNNGKVKLLLAFSKNLNEIVRRFEKNNKNYNNFNNIKNFINQKKFDFIERFLQSDYLDPEKINILAEILKNEYDFNFVKNDLLNKLDPDIVVKAFEKIFIKENINVVNQDSDISPYQIELLINFISQHMDIFMNRMNPQILEEIISNYIKNKYETNFDEELSLINSGVFKNPKLMIILLNEMFNWYMYHDNPNNEYMIKYKLLLDQYKQSFENIDFQNDLLSLLEWTEWADKNLIFLTMIPWYPEQLKKVNRFLIEIFIKKNNDDGDEDEGHSSIRKYFDIFLNAIDNYFFDDNDEKKSKESAIWYDLLRSIDSKKYKSNKVIQNLIMKKYFNSLTSGSAAKFDRAYKMLVDHEILFPTYQLLKNKDTETLKNWHIICEKQTDESTISKNYYKKICKKYFREIYQNFNDQPIDIIN